METNQEKKDELIVRESKKRKRKRKKHKSTKNNKKRTDLPMKEEHTEKTPKEVSEHSKKKMKKSTKIALYTLGLIIGGGSVFSFAQSAPSSTQSSTALANANHLQKVIESSYIDQDSHVRMTNDNLDKVFLNYHVVVNEVKSLKDKNDKAIFKSKEIISDKDVKKLESTTKLYEEIKSTEETLSKITTEQITFTTKTKSEINLSSGLNSDILNEVKDALSTSIQDEKLIKSATDVVEVASESTEARDEAKAIIKKELDNNKELKIDKDTTKKIDELVKKIKSKEELEEIATEKQSVVKSQEETEQKIKEKEEAEAQKAAEEQAEAERAQIKANESHENKVEASSQGNTSKTNSVESESSPKANTRDEGSTSSSPQEIPSGFAYNGYSYPLGTFSGWGLVPADGYVYRWANDPSHYLIERLGSAGGTIRSVRVGSTVYVDQKAYTVYKVESGVANTDDTGPYLHSQRVDGGISFQTCDNDSPHTTLTLWWAK